MKYHSQIGQDKYIDDALKGKEFGVFVEVGAFDGKEQSNSLFFEEERQWEGLCIEPHPNLYKQLKANRACKTENFAISNEEGDAKFLAVDGYSSSLSGLTKHYESAHKDRISAEINEHKSEFDKITVKMIPLQKLLDKYGFEVIDYCSVDVEGAELQVLESIDFEKTHIKYFSIENNYNTTDCKDFLETKGYSLVTKIKWDDIFVKD